MSQEVIEPNPTSAMLVDPIWDAIWQVVKDWDIRAPWQGGGYCGGTGSHATAIFLAIEALAKRTVEPSEEMIEAATADYIRGRGGHEGNCAHRRQGCGCNCRAAEWASAFPAGFRAAMQNAAPKEERA